MNENIGFLHPITKDFRKIMPECISQFCRWRKENPSMSPSIFEITIESTEQWLEKNVVNNDQRILFSVQNIKKENIGHIGFAGFEYETKSAEIDLVLCGVKHNSPQLMEYAIRTLVEWGKQTLCFEHIGFRVLSDNDHAIRFYKRCGFKENGLIPLQ